MEIWIQERRGNVESPASFAPTSVLEAMDDPQKLAWRVSSDWRVIEKLAIGRRLPDGRDVKSTHLIISAGDFIDVGVNFAIVYRNGRLSVQLVMTHVLQLASASSVAQVGVFK